VSETARLHFRVFSAQFLESSSENSLAKLIRDVPLAVEFGISRRLERMSHLISLEKNFVAQLEWSEQSIYFFTNGVTLVLRNVGHGDCGDAAVTAVATRL
jgi:hypothetical protein